ncbi:MAG TPA: ribbon-helix-helix protein, CopG family [Bdellovibrionota bacterium]|nr:ribbon-helix-helix protein, CopG family [Bdellovibrionota bacterium]
MKRKSLISVRIPKELGEIINEFCKKTRLPLSDLVRESIKRYIAVEQFRHVRKKILPFAEAQGLLTDEDIFKAIS